MEILQKIKNDLLEQVHSGNSFFKFIPEEIGNIVYCDTSKPLEGPLTKEEARKKKIKASLIAVIGLAAIWGLLYSHYIWASILSIVLLLICYAIFDTSFKGTDYFVGENGYAVVSFEDNRDNITSKKIILFKDLSYLFTGEMIHKQNYTYMNTEYYFSLFYKSENNVFNRADNVKGSYNDKNPKDPMNPNGSSHEYQLMKAVENQWTLYFFNSHKDDEEVNFAIWPDKVETIYSDAIKIGHDYIDIGGVKYNQQNTKKVYFSNGSLVVEHINHKTKWFGFKHEGNINSIPLADLGNKKAFMMLFESFYKL